MLNLLLGEKPTRRWLLAGVLALLTSIAVPTRGDVPDAGAPAGRSPDVQALLKQGRVSGEKKDFAGAERLFLQALAKAPHDPDLLLELGWAQFQLGKLVEARKMTLAALEHAGRPGHYAAASYNLGRMEEAAGNERIAAADYRRSLAWQKGTAPALRERAKVLDQRLAAAPSRLLGPFKSIDAMCPELAASEDRMRIDAANVDQEDHYECGECEFVCHGNPVKQIKEGLPPPLSEVVLFLSESRDNTPKAQRNHSSPAEYDEVFLNAAVRVGADWYLAPALNSGPSWNPEALQVLDASVKPVGPQGARVVVIQFSASQGESNMFGDVREEVGVIGSGPSGKPALLAPVLIGSKIGTYPYGEIRCVSDTETITQRQWKFAEGALVVTGETVVERLCKKKTRKTQKLSERHPLNFP